jgi:hypothetical protein
MQIYFLVLQNASPGDSIRISRVLSRNMPSISEDQFFSFGALTSQFHFSANEILPDDRNAPSIRTATGTFCWAIHGSVLVLRPMTVEKVISSSSEEIVLAIASVWKALDVTHLSRNRPFCKKSLTYTCIRPGGAMSASLCSGFDHSFRRQDGVDRSAAALFRQSVRTKSHTGQTSGCASGFLQANFVALPKEFAFDFMLFCLRNPRPCPLLDVIEAGSKEPSAVAPGADVTTDIPRYVH